MQKPKRDSIGEDVQWPQLREEERKEREERMKSKETVVKRGRSGQTASSKQLQGRLQGREMNSVESHTLGQTAPGERDLLTFEGSYGGHGQGQ